MNEEQTDMPQGDPGGRQPTEEELRAALEQQMKEVRVEDVLLQSVASLVNLTARRIGKEDERDLAQARVGIEAVRALVDLLPDEAATQVRNALSELQTLYAQVAASGEGGEGEAEPPSGGTAPGQAPQQPRQTPSGQPPKSKLWTPGSN
jgi:hypothetical protein